jgi:hypothetical protein
MKGKVSKEQFIDVWAAAHQQGHNTLWVARQLNITHQAAYYWKGKLRKQGVPLPDLLLHDNDDSERLAIRLSQQLGDHAKGSTDAVA